MERREAFIAAALAASVAPSAYAQDASPGAAPDAATDGSTEGETEPEVCLCACDVAGSGGFSLLPVVLAGAGALALGRRRPRRTREEP